MPGDMKIAEDESQRNDFRNILFDLAKDQEMLQDSKKRSEMYQRLEQLYYNPDPSKRFRHYYSDIFQVLAIIKQDGKKGDINILGQNLGVLREGYQAINSDSNGGVIDISAEIRKLYDHVSLDIARMTYSDRGDWEVSGKAEIEKAQEAVNGLKDTVNGLESDVDDAVKKMSNSAKEYIAILGIFASIVIAFTAGISFSTSILGAINKASIYRISLMVSIIGLVFTNILFWLFYYIDRLVNGSVKRNYKILLISNLIFIGLIAAICLAWNFGFVEYRNIKLGH